MRRARPVATHGQYTNLRARRGPGILVRRARPIPVPNRETGTRALVDLKCFSTEDGTELWAAQAFVDGTPHGLDSGGPEGRVYTCGNGTPQVRVFEPDGTRAPISVEADDSPTTTFDVSVAPSGAFYVGYSGRTIVVEDGQDILGADALRHYDSDGTVDWKRKLPTPFVGNESEHVFTPWLLDTDSDGNAFAFARGDLGGDEFNDHSLLFRATPDGTVDPIYIAWDPVVRDDSPIPKAVAVGTRERGRVAVGVMHNAIFFDRGRWRTVEMLSEDRDVFDTNAIWSIPIGDGFGDGIHSVEDLVVDGDGNTIVAGPGIIGTRRASLRKIDVGGNFVWQLPDPVDQEWSRLSVDVDAAGNIYTSGDSYDHDGKTVNIVKRSPQGEFLWGRVFGEADAAVSDPRVEWVSVDSDRGHLYALTTQPVIGRVQQLPISSTAAIPLRWRDA